MSEDIRVVSYLNQFFGGIGGEEKAGEGCTIRPGAIGPGNAIQSALGTRGKVVATIVCGDNYFAEKEEETIEEAIQLIKPYQPSVLIAGPAFNAGRYGFACGAICKAVQNKLGIPAVTAMYKENPGMDLYKHDVYIVKTGDSPKEMSDVITKMLNIAGKLLANEEIGKPVDEGYFPRGFVRNEISDKTAAERAVSMLLTKLQGQPYEPETIILKFKKIKPPPAIKDLHSAKIALATDGGLVPKGNPDNLPPRISTRFGSYSIKGLETLDRGDWEVTHVGYEHRFVLESPNRLVPVDTLRLLEKEGVVEKLHETFYSTAGVATPPANCSKIGQGIAEELKDEGVDGVILTST